MMYTMQEVMYNYQQQNKAMAEDASHTPDHLTVHLTQQGVGFYG